MNLGQAIDAVGRRHDEYREVVAPVGAVLFDDGGITLGDGRFGLAPFGSERLMQLVGAPRAYLERLPTRLRSALFSYHFGVLDVERLAFVIQDDTLVGVRPVLEALSAADVLTAVGEGLDSDELRMQQLTFQEHSFSADLVWPGRGVEAVPGDVVEAGLSVSYSYVGAFATNVTGYTLRLVCSNGMVVKQCFGCNPSLRTRRLPEDFPNARDLMLNQIRRVAARAWESVHDRLSRLQGLSQQGINVEHAIRSWLRRARLGAESLGDQVLEAWRRDGAAEHLWAAVNALTAVGTHARDIGFRQRRLLRQLAGAVAMSGGANVCPRCLSLLREPA